MVEKKLFDTLNGEDVFLYTLSNDQMEVDLLPMGAAIQALRVPDREGKLVDVCLGYDNVSSYQKLSACVGGTLGRCANRIGGAQFTLNGQVYKLPANSGPNSIHGGLAGFHQRMWKVSKALPGENFICFDYFSRDGEEGYPGNLNVRVTYRLEGTTLTMEYDGSCDQDTIVNMTNHCYFNLAGHKGGEVYDHEIRVRASAYTPTDENNVPTGEIAGVEGTALDLREPRLVGDVLKDPSLKRTMGLDHNLILTCGFNTPAAELYCPRTGIDLKVVSTQEGMQVYSAGWLDRRAGKDGAVYGPYQAICFESQHFPNAINCPGFPSPILRTGERYGASTSWTFSVR